MKILRYCYNFTPEIPGKYGGELTAHGREVRVLWQCSLKRQTASK